MSQHHTLFELNKLVQQTLDKSLAPSYWVVAEIADLRVNQNGHCYLELVQKEDERVIAKSRATIWSYTYSNLSLWFEKMTNESLRSGLKVLCNVSVQYHEIYGLSFNIKDIDANYTLGERERKRQEVIQLLIEDGVFEMNKTIEIGPVFTSLAIISSPTAAGFEDFMNQLVNNSYGYEYQTRLFKATMQGEQAAESIINALHTINESSEHYDAVVIIRGGGSRIDLDCFDDYDLNSHICQFPIAILAGIGHERDESIVDLVANKSLKTPTAVAEWVIGKSLDYESSLVTKMISLTKLFNNQLSYEKNSLERLTSKLKNSTERQIQSKENWLDKAVLRMDNSTKQYLLTQFQNLSLMESRVEYLNPETVLKRGFTITTKGGKQITTENVKEGDIIETITLSSILESKVYNTKDR